MRIKSLRNLLWTVNSLLVAGMVGFVLIGFVFSSRGETGPSRPDRGGASARPPVPTPDPGPILKYKYIFELPISGFPPEPPPEVVDTGPAKVIPPLAQNYDLLWVTLYPDNIDSIAQIVRKGGTEILFLRVGGKIEGWKLVEVRVSEGSRGEAVFEQTESGEQVTLSQNLAAAAKLFVGQPGGPGGPGGAGTASGDGPFAARSEAIPSYEEGPTREAVTLPGQPNHYQFPIEEQRWVERHAEKIAEEANLETIRDSETGRPIGIQVRSFNRENSTLARYGIREGDVLVSINGEPMSSKAEAMTWLRGPGKGKERYVGVVLRKGRQVTITYDVPQK